MPGWSVRDLFQWYDNSNTWQNGSRGRAIRIAIKGPSRVTFDPGEITRELNENTGANQDVGSPVTAAYTGTCTLTHTLVGADAASFQIDSATGQIKTRAGVTYDHEARSSYTVTVAASDANCGAASAAVTINVNDVNERPLVPRRSRRLPRPRHFRQHNSALDASRQHRPPRHHGLRRRLCPGRERERRRQQYHEYHADWTQARTP